MEYKNFHLINYVLSLFPENLLENTFLIGCQHLLPSVELLLDALFKKGLCKKNVALIGKCYSSSSLTIKKLNEKNIFIDPNSQKFDSHQSYNTTLHTHLVNFFSKEIKKIDIKKYKNIVILDDGGDLHLITHKLLSDHSKIIGVEQTSRGAHQLAVANLKYPIINVARCKAKLIYESPMVADAIMNGLYKFLSPIKIQPKHALVVGKGNIGKSLVPQLQQICNVTAFDLLESQTDISENALREMSDNIDLIVGCTGQNILPFLKRNNLLKKQMILASASSSDIEFNAHYFRSQCDKDENCHKTYYANGIYILNGGFPVNFYGGERDQISLEKFQLTSALLLAGILQGIENKKNKNTLVDLDEEMQLSILKKFNEIRLPHFNVMHGITQNTGLIHNEAEIF